MGCYVRICIWYWIFFIFLVVSVYFSNWVRMFVWIEHAKQITMDKRGINQHENEKEKEAPRKFHLLLTNVHCAFQLKWMKMKTIDKKDKNQQKMMLLLARANDLLWGKIRNPNYCCNESKYKHKYTPRIEIT